MWLKVDGLAKAMRTILIAEEGQNQTLTQQARKAEAATIQAQQAEHTRSIQFDAATKVLTGVLRQVTEIQSDIQTTLAKAEETNQLVLEQSQATKAAALESQLAASKAAGAAQSAATQSTGAANAAYRAAATSSHTAGVVSTKVVTTADRRALQAQQRALAAKSAQLSRTIRQVKKNGPTLIQQIFH
jgi:hypothetical protein